MKINGGQKTDEEEKISKSNQWPIILEIVDLHMKSASENLKY